MLLVTSLWWAVQLGVSWPSLPYRYDPWAPLQFDAPPDRFLRSRLAVLERDPAACLELLSQTPLRVRVLENRVTGAGCGFENAVEIRRTAVESSPAFSLSCRAAVSLAKWERHVLHPAAHQQLGSEVARIEHFGSYACRNVYGRENGRRSQHATADALDIAGFVLRDGRRIRVLADWPGDDANATFLRTVRDGACTYFDAVLGPDYNEAHRDHFHVDRGRVRICR
ncbi:MAG: extensin family protein [Xanthomonadales bacterium]|nr:extensin family protein [Xanthomonadales bacterium]